jgi:serine/threonine protein kinase
VKLQELEGYYSSDTGRSFREACEDALSGVDFSRDIRPSEEIIKGAIGTARIDKTNSETPIISGNMASIRGAMGSWKPPPQKGRMSSGEVMPSSSQPPATVTGVAPWAVVGQNRPKQPPLTVTGVAPWAMAKQTARRPLDAPLRPSKNSQLMGGVLPPMSNRTTLESAVDASEILDDGSESHRENCSHVNKSLTAVDLVRTYMDKLRPKGGGEESTDGVSSWAKAQMDESPVLLHNLKFHDLVFGQELGSGAFSTVKYARHIVKTLTRSSWPEYAVKIVSTQKIEEMGYEQSISREIAILRILSHPGISRLISSFRFRDGAYLVLEYASGGDLHTLLRRNGSLDHDSTRFVIGSVAAALSSIHELGFVFADCKPENILITETGHIKITDFGGCRPVTQEAKLLVDGSSKNLLRQLRDGDWRPPTTPCSGDGTTEEHYEEDLRIEGTTAYLPPEVVVGGYPTTAADIWALGCVLFQCISGRPPILEDNDHLTVKKIVTFNLESDEENFFGDWNVAAFCNDAKALIRRMLHHDASCRPNVMLIAEAAFFEGMDIFTLHKKPAHPLDVGSIAPDSDAKWSRRQFRYATCIIYLRLAILFS